MCGVENSVLLAGVFDLHFGLGKRRTHDKDPPGVEETGYETLHLGMNPINCGFQVRLGRVWTEFVSDSDSAICINDYRELDVAKDLQVCARCGLREDHVPVWLDSRSETFEAFLCKTVVRAARLANNILLGKILLVSNCLLTRMSCRCE